VTSVAAVPSLQAGWRVAVAGGCELAERPVWDDVTDSLVWADVLAGTVHRSTPGRARSGPWPDEAVRIGSVVGALALRSDGGLVAAADSAFVLLDHRGRADADPVEVDLPAGQRFNDAACDPAGRLLAGTTSTVGELGAGVLWSLDATGAVSVLLAGVTESNGLGWSADGSVLYYVDSGEPVVRRYAYDPGTGALGRRLPDLVELAEGEGVPDGLVVDRDGAVWFAAWDGGCVRRYSPLGELLEQRALPVTRPTCPGFAGPALDVLVVTTAWEGLDQAERARQPWAGHVLVAEAGAAGRPAHRYGGGPR
jgi:sugar lactone lactonase YvrE